MRKFILVALATILFLSSAAHAALSVTASASKTNPAIGESFTLTAIAKLDSASDGTLDSIDFLNKGTSWDCDPTELTCTATFTANESTAQAYTYNFRAFSNSDSKDTSVTVNVGTASSTPQQPSQTTTDSHAPYVNVYYPNPVVVGQDFNVVVNEGYSSQTDSIDATLMNADNSVNKKVSWDCDPTELTCTATFTFKINSNGNYPLKIDVYTSDEKNWPWSNTYTLTTQTPVTSTPTPSSSGSSSGGSNGGSSAPVTNVNYGSGGTWFSDAVITHSTSTQNTNPVTTPSGPTFKIKVVDKIGSPINDALVTIESKTISYQRTTDSNGNTNANVVSDCYDITVQKSGYIFNKMNTCIANETKDITMRESTEAVAGFFTKNNLLVGVPLAIIILISIIAIIIYSKRYLGISDKNNLEIQ